MEIERRFDLAEIKQVDIRIGLGDLTAAAGSGDQIGLRARLRSDDESELETSVADGAPGQEPIGQRLPCALNSLCRPLLLSPRVSTGARR